jgi:hypothetical protein
MIDSKKFSKDILCEAAKGPEVQITDGSRNFCPSALTVNAGENPKVLSKDEPKENGKRRKGAQGLTPGLYFLGFLEQELFLYLFEIYYVLSSIPFSLQRLVFWASF